MRPDWGLVVNVGESHIELLGSRENIARAKAELLCALPEGTGRAFVNADDDYADFVREHARLDARRVETVLFDGSAAAAERRAQAEAAEAARTRAPRPRSGAPAASRFPSAPMPSRMPSRKPAARKCSVRAAGSPW